MFWLGLNHMCYDCKDIQAQHGVIYSSDAAPERHAHQGRQRPVPHPRPAPSDARQQARAHPVPHAQHPDARRSSDYKFRAEEDVERAMLDEREMQYLYNDGDHFYFMDTSTYEQIHISHEALGDSKNYLIPDSIIRVEFYESEPVGHRAAADRRSRRQGNRARHQGRDRQRAGQAGDARDRPGRAGAAVCQRRRQDPCQHRDRGVPVAGLTWKWSGKQPQHGWIEVIAGSMFSGKSEELIRRLRRAQIARQKVQIFKPLIDNRFSEDHIVSHSDMRIASENVQNSDELIRHVSRRHRGGRHRRRAVLRCRTCRPPATPWRIAASG